jgi:sigma-B regulation protein RsbU (phosphoserine phosphatase)
MTNSMWNTDTENGVNQEFKLTINSSRFVLSNRDMLTNLPICADIPPLLLEPFLTKCEYRFLNTGELLISPNEENHYLFILLSGKLSIHIDTIESDKGFFVSPGDLVGEVSIIDGQAPTAYVSASEYSLVMSIHETVLWSDFIRIPGAANNLLRQIAGRMRNRNAAMQRSLEQTLRLEHLEKELSIAQDLQMGVLALQPFFPNHPQIEVDAIMIPAKEVGGDFFDAISLDSDRICIAIGDVAGKGIPAALFMMRTITLLRTEMLKTKNLLKTIHAINETLSRDNPMCMFVTLMICVVNVREGQMFYVNGGHNRLLLGNITDGFEYLEQPKGILVGVSPTAAYEVTSRNLNVGDMLVMYTDGITEAMNPDHEEFTEKRLLECVNRHKQLSSQGMISGIQDAVFEFASTAEQSDDLTLLAIRYRKN